MNVYHGLGVMSGSSLDGIDFALCRFTFDETAENPILEWHIVDAETFELSVFWEERLKKAYLASAKELWLAHVTFGKYIGDLANTFMKKGWILSLILFPPTDIRYSMSLKTI